jgi:hypothetical protein
MVLNANAKLGLAGRLGMVRAVADAMTLKLAAAVFSVPPATAHRPVVAPLAGSAPRDGPAEGR